MSEEKKAKSTEKKSVAKKTTKKSEDGSLKAEAKKTIKPQKPEVTQDSEISLQKSDAKLVAKAGKRSEKALKDAEEKQAKEIRKTETAETEKPKAKPQKVRSKLERKSKGYRKSSKLLEDGKTYSVKQAAELATKTSHVKFDATVEVHARLGVDPRQADQNIRDMLVLPAGTGKTVRVAVFCDAEQVAAAKKAGADVAAADEFMQQLDKELIDFDVLIATPSMMPKLSKYARLLGPKGLMPNPKSGTVTNDIAKAVTAAKAGRVEYRVDSTGIVHVGVGKVSFGADRLAQNINALIASIKNNKPSSLKGTYVKSIYVTTSMGPSVSIDINEAA